MRRTEVTVETDEVWVMRGSGRMAMALCPECGKEVPMITPEEAVILSGLSARSIYRGVEARLIHYLETPGGFLLICAKSITGPADRALPMLKQTRLEVRDE